MPPAKIKSVPGAEAWALWLVLSTTTERKQIVTDCLGNLQKLRRGRAWATAPSRAGARVSNLIFHMLGGCEDHSWLVWMPSHCNKEQASQKNKSDGSVITLLDLRANDAADALAKSAAHSHRAPLHVRRRIAEAKAAYMYGRAILGTVTYASQNYQLRTTDDNGEPKTVVRRDSMGKPPGNAPKALRRPRGTPPPQPSATPAVAADQRAETRGDMEGRIDRAIQSAARRMAGGRAAATSRDTQQQEQQQQLQHADALSAATTHAQNLRRGRLASQAEAPMAATASTLPQRNRRETRSK